MTVWLTRVHVSALGVRDAVRGYWKRIAVGAFFGWLISTVLGAFALVGFESFHLIAADDSPLLGAAIVWMGIAVGGAVAYVARPIPIEEREVRR